MSQRSSRAVAVLAGTALMFGGAGVAIGSAGKTAADPARAIHEKQIVLDTHFDTPANLGRPGWSIMDRHVAVTDGDQVDYPRMVDGGVDGGFFAIYTPSGPRTPDGDRAARDFGIQRAVQIREMVAKHGNVFSLALTADDAERAVAAHKRFVFMSMETAIRSKAI